MLRTTILLLALATPIASTPLLVRGAIAAGVPSPIAKEGVRYRCEKWKAKHLHDSKKADTIAETLTKLQCEVKRVPHGDHEDLRYRCEEWKTLELKSHDEAIKWETWLREYGFEAQHQH